VAKSALQVQLPSVLQRMPLTIDPLSEAGSKVTDGMLPRRTAAVSSFYLGIDRVRLHLQRIVTALSARTLPESLTGIVMQPDGTAGGWLQIQFDPSSVGSRGPKIIALSGYDGRFTLRFPAGTALPDSGLPLTVHGGSGNATLIIPPSQITANVIVGSVMLASPLTPLHVSIIEALTAFLPKEPPSPQSSSKSTAQLHVVKLGEDDACQLSFRSNSAVDKFPFGVFFRLVEPQTSIPHVVLQVPSQSGRYFPLPRYTDGAVSTGLGGVSYADRVPIEQPLSVDGFRDQLMGVGAAGTVSSEETVPMAGTLGLGYTLWMSQRWTFQGLGLGDLVYSLALSPGEQQQVAIFERVDTAAVTESEFFSEEEVRDEAAKSDTSTQATFNSAFNEMVNGGSQFSTHASSASNASQGAFSVGIISAGGSGSSGTSDASGVNTQWLQGQRNTTQQAAESTHSAADSHAAARRSAMRTSMRMATASESESVTTRVITNHNHTRALTLQYWEVLRLYDVTTAIDGLTLTCLIPMQVVRFLPPGQPLTLALADPLLVSSRASVMMRYSSIIKHADVLAQALPRRLQYGLTLLQQFAADPTATVDPFGGAAQDVIQFRLEGTFLPCEDVYITAVTKRNTRIGPVRLVNAAQIPADRYSSREELVAALRSDRQTNTKTLTANLALPASLNRNDVVGFEFSRRFRTIDYTLVAPEIAAVNVLQALFPNAPPSWLNVGPLKIGEADAHVLTRSTIHLAPSELESELGGPLLRHFQAAIQELDAQGNPNSGDKDETFVRGETYANDSLNGVELPPQPYPIPAIQLGPVLRFNQILEIEKTVQHVVRNTVQYSRAVWASISPDERAILLEHYTIGVPSDGVADPSQMVPLLNCVENRVLGFFGNSMMMPFMIPQAVAEQMGIDPAELQDGLLAFQREAFVSPQSTIALPTRGVLGEAILGHCSSAEKIDLTRFWNWADAPADSAPAISPVTLPTMTPSIAAGLTAPNNLTNLPPLINNVLTAPTPDTSLLQALSKAAASQQDFSQDFTGAKQLSDLVSNAQKTADAARASALQENSKVLSKAIDASTEIIKQAIQSYAQTSQSSTKPNTSQATQGQPSPGKTPSTGQPSSPSSKPPTGADGSQPASSPDEWQPYPGTKAANGLPTASSPDEWQPYQGTATGSDTASPPPLVSSDSVQSIGTQRGNGGNLVEVSNVPGAGARSSTQQGSNQAFRSDSAAAAYNNALEILWTSSNPSGDDFFLLIDQLKILTWDDLLSVLKALARSGPTFEGMTWLELLYQRGTTLTVDDRVMAAVTAVLLAAGGRVIRDSADVTKCGSLAQRLLNLSGEDQRNVLAIVNLKDEVAEGTIASIFAEAIQAGLVQSPIAAAVTGDFGDWNRPGGMPVPYYIGQLAHQAIAAYYTENHPPPEHYVATNTVPIEAIVDKLVSDFGFTPGQINASAIRMMPDIFEFSIAEVPPGVVYEIKPWSMAGIAEAEALAYGGILNAAHIPVALGNIGRPGTEGVVPAPNGWFVFESPAAGVIAYQYLRAATVEIAERDRVRGRKSEGFTADELRSAIPIAGATTGFIALAAAIIEALGAGGFVLGFAAI
jgi:hypothetical protein